MKIILKSNILCKIRFWVLLNIHEQFLWAESNFRFILALLLVMLGILSEFLTTLTKKLRPNKIDTSCLW